MLLLGYERCWCADLSRGGIQGYGCSRWMSSPWVWFLWALKYLQGLIFTLCACETTQTWWCLSEVVVGLWWCQAGGTIHPWPVQQMLAGMSSCWCWWGQAFPRGCGSFACEMCGVGAAWLSSAAKEQGSGLCQVPGLFLQWKRGRCGHPVMEVLTLSIWLV